MTTDRQQEDPTEPTEPAEPTYDGKRLQINEINTGAPAAGKSGLSRALRNLSLFFAGMYTGESCAGTPHSDRKKSRRESRD